MSDWEQRYQEGDVQWDKGEASPGLVDWLAENARYTTGKVIVPGCGFGHDARAWGKAGVDAVGYDLAPAAVKGAEDQTSESLTNVTFRLGDFLEDEPFDFFDYVFEHTFFCAIAPDRRPDHVAACRNWLKPEGKLLAVHYMLPKDEEGPPFGTDREEIIERFSTSFQLLSDWSPRSYPHRTGLERMFLWEKKD